MKSKFLRIISLILVLASLVSMFGVFAYADSSAVGLADGNDPTVPEQTDPFAEVLKEFPGFELLYQRNYEEGWAFNNGMSWVDRGSSLDVDYEMTEDYSYNYFMRFTTHSAEHTYLELNFNNARNTGAVIEFDIMSDDFCHFPNLFQFCTSTSGNARTYVNFLGVSNNVISFFTKADAGYMLEDGTSTVGRDPLEDPNDKVISDADLKAWSNISDQWLHVALVLDFTYGDVVETDPDTGEITNIYTPDPDPDARRPEPPSAGGVEDDSNPTNYRNYFTMALYIAPTDEYERSGELYLVDQRTVRGSTTSGGEGIGWIRISTSGAAKEYWDSSICLDNIVYYTGANEYGLATEAMGNGSKVNTSAGKAYEVLGGSSGKVDVDYLREAVAMKLGVDYMRVNGEQVAIITDENGNATGAPFKDSEGNVLIPLIPVLDSLGYRYYMHEDGLYLDISAGSTAAYLSVGKTNATVNGQRVFLSVAPGYYNDVLYVGIDDFNTLLPEKYAQYDSMGLIVFSDKDGILNRDLYLDTMLEIMKGFVFDYATPDEIIEDVRENTNNFEHPYLLGNKDDFDWLRSAYTASADDENFNASLQSAIQRMVGYAENVIKIYARPEATLRTYNVIVTDEDGNKVQETDEEGKPVVDEWGNPVYKTEQLPVISWGVAYDRKNSSFTYNAFDKTGALIPDANGNAPYVQAKDEDGNPLVDDEGDPIYVKAQYKLTEGENGPEYVLDEEYEETETDRYGNTVNVRYHTEVSVDDEGVRTPLYLVKYVSKYSYSYKYDKYLGIFDDGIDYNGDFNADELYYHIVDNYGASAYNSYSLTQPDYDNGGHGYDIEGGRCNASSGRNERAFNLAFGWQMTRDVRYLLAAYDMAVSLGALFKHWGPGHFLNCADAATPFAYMLDLCYDGFLALGSSDYAAELAALGVSEEGIQNVTDYNASMGRDNTYYDVRKISNILYEKGVWEGYISSHDLYTTYLSPIVGAGGSLYRTRTNNWNAVCSAGMVIASLAVIDCDFVSDNFEVKGLYGQSKAKINKVDENGVSIVEGTIQQHAAWLIANNIENLITYGLDCYAPDGAYNESPSYWAYGTNTFFRMCLVLDSAAGTNYRLMNCWGIDTTCYYACQTETNEFRTFSYHDGSMSSQETSMFFYASEALGDDAIAQVRLHQIAGGKSINLYDIMAYPRRELAEADEMSLDYYSKGIDLYASRSSWERGALYIGIIGGANKHPHNQIDAGTFVYHNNGAPWFLDLGTENYNAVGFWPDATRYRYYVMKPEGHNTITVTSDNINVPWGQKLSGVAYAYDYGYNDYGSYVKYEMTDVLGGTADYWRRAVMLTNNRTTTIIQDEISSNGVQSYYWFGHYSLKYVKDVELSDDGRTAYMYGKDNVTIDDSKILRVTIVSPQTDLKFELMDTYTFVHNEPDTGTYDKEWVNAQGPDEKDRSEYRKLAIAGGGQLGLTFNVAIVIELISKDQKDSGHEPAVEYTWTEIKDWKEPVESYDGTIKEEGETRPAATRRDFGSNVQRAWEMFGNKTAFNDNFGSFYRTLTDSYYIYSILQSQLGSGYAEQIGYYNTMKTSFASFRAAVFKISATRDGVVTKLLGQ